MGGAPLARRNSIYDPGVVLRLSYPRHGLIVRAIIRGSSLSIDIHARRHSNDVWTFSSFLWLSEERSEICAFQLGEHTLSSCSCEVVNSLELRLYSNLENIFSVNVHQLFVWNLKFQLNLVQNIFYQASIIKSRLILKLTTLSRVDVIV